MTGETVGFWAVATVLLASSLAVVLTPNLFHAVLFLAVALVSTGGVFLLLHAPFLFGVQLLLYAGGVVTILVFAIMLTERLVGERIRQTSRHLVNGGPGVEVPLTGTSFSTVATKAVTVTLNTGPNSIKFYNDNAYAPDLDKISVN